MRNVINDKVLNDLLKEKLKSPVASATSVSGGSISQAAIIRTQGGEQFFVKWNKESPPGFFEAEKRGLAELSKCKELVIPEVFFYSERALAAPGFIVLEVLTSSVSSFGQLGARLAALHRIKAESFGLDHDNFIGITPQRNSPDSDWGTFFYQHRLSPQSELGQRKGWVTREMGQALESLKSEIIELLSKESEAPCLLHGDLWSGNVFWSDRGPAVIDPAVYYGHREADIAMTELFGGFSADFLKSYNEHYPLSRLYPERRDILNLYHLMNHANLFSGHYVQSVKNILKSLMKRF